MVINMTRKLYYEDAYLKEAKGRVLEIRDNAILLDQTIFYPTGEVNLTIGEL